MVRRYASKLGIPRCCRPREQKLMRVIREQKLLGGRCPHSIVSAVIFIIGTLFVGKEPRRFLKEIADHIHIAPNTIAACITILLPHVPWEGSASLLDFNHE